MLIKVFGIWLMTSNVLALKPYGADCFVDTIKGVRAWQIIIEDRTCDQVAEEIKRQLKHEK